MEHCECNVHIHKNLYTWSILSNDEVIKNFASHQTRLENHINAEAHPTTEYGEFRLEKIKPYEL